MFRMVNIYFDLMGAANNLHSTTKICKASLYRYDEDKNEDHQIQPSKYLNQVDQYFPAFVNTEHDYGIDVDSTFANQMGGDDTADWGNERDSFCLNQFSDGNSESTAAPADSIEQREHFDPSKSDVFDNHSSQSKEVRSEKDEGSDTETVKEDTDDVQPAKEKMNEEEDYYFHSDYDSDNEWREFTNKWRDYERKILKVTDERTPRSVNNKRSSVEHILRHFSKNQDDNAKEKSKDERAERTVNIIDFRSPKILRALIKKQTERSTSKDDGFLAAVLLTLGWSLWSRYFQKEWD